MTLEAKYAIQILKSVIEEKTSPEPPSEINWEVLYRFAVEHRVENIIYAGLSRLNCALDEKMMSVLAQQDMNCLGLSAMQEIELEQISYAFEKNHIRHMPLKGSILRYLYPSPDYRQSGDIDILIYPEELEKVSDILVGLGYEREVGYDSHEIHLSFLKAPALHIEIHKSLVSKDSRTNNFCKTVWENTCIEEGFEYRYKMDKEYFFVYIVAHMAKHLNLGGAGIRLVLDIWVLLRKWNGQLDFVKIDKLMKKARLTEIYQYIYELIGKWFEDKSTDDEIVLKLEEYVLESGCFGNAENEEVMRSSKNIWYKLSSIKRYLFMDADLLKGDYPILNKTKLVLPFVWIHRLVKKVLFERKRVQDRFKHCTGDGVGDKSFSVISNAVSDLK